MATRVKKVNWIKGKVWTERMTMEIEGPLLSSLVHMFIMAGSKEKREKLLDEFQKAHADMCEREAQKPAEAA
jgi:hypothetical protein